MNYTLWSQEYFKEAQILKEKVSSLKHQLKTSNDISISETNRRIAILYSMYLECIHTAKTLQKRGEFNI